MKNNIFHYGIELKSPITLFGVIRFDRIPTQLIEALFEILLFVILFIWQRKDNKKDFLKIYLITYSIFRFLIEFFRGDDVRGYFFGFSTSQIISISIWMYYLLKKSMKNKKPKWKIREICESLPCFMPNFIRHRWKMPSWSDSDPPF